MDSDTGETGEAEDQVDELPEPVDQDIAGSTTTGRGSAAAATAAADQRWVPRTGDVDRPRSASSPARVSSAGGKFRSKARAAFNNLANGWVIPVPTIGGAFRSGEPIWFLGQHYHGTATSRKSRSFSLDQKSSKKAADCPGHLAAFLSDFHSRFWITYRRKFAIIGDSSYSCDTGWGCMIRTGQMLVAQALCELMLGRDWRIGEKSKKADGVEHQLVSLFNDRMADDCPLSIHKLLSLGHQRPGQWLGPAEVSHLLRKAVDEAYHQCPPLQNFRIYVAQDSTVYKGDVHDLMIGANRSLLSSGGSRRSSGVVDADVGEGQASAENSVLVLVPVRLGRSRLNPIYAPCLQTLLALDCCVGVIGGRPKHSLYFIGCQGSELIYLDPHFCQDFVDSSRPGFPTASYHCQSPRKMSSKAIDPSCALGFLFDSREHMERSCPKITECATPPMMKTRYPIFTFSEQRLADISSVEPRCRNVPSIRRPQLGEDARAETASLPAPALASTSLPAAGDAAQQRWSDGDLDDFVLMES
eukprot:scpid49671/ scgid2528/ Cysteine protease ATG4C; Autophagy-related protein 4 homolog C